MGNGSPNWLGAFAIGLSLSAIIFPVLTVAATFTAAAIISLLFGIEQVIGRDISVQAFSICSYWSCNISHNPFKHCFGIPRIIPSTKLKFYL